MESKVVRRKPYQPQRRQKKEEAVSAKIDGPVKKVPLSIAEWENPLTLSPEVRILRMKNAFRPRGFIAGEVRMMEEDADSRSKK